ncbi:MAG: TonB-dependent siderophore receptor [Azonexus sp.]|nr:TonB-dependent siderophore receptor [Azonexus sp.]MCK6412569.1 TonB-dependent siderophore receptor [Azonexus sp.]
MLPFQIKPSLLAVVAGLATVAVAQAQEQSLAPVVVKDRGEIADGPVAGYRATRSASFTKTDTALKDVPASVAVVGEEMVKDQAMRGMGDVLRYVPGASMAQGEGNRDQMVIRGINSTADFFVNGVRDDTQYFRDLYNVERVEAIKGPAGMAFGRGGAGGVVNRVTKRADFTRHADASLTLGSYGQVRASGDLGGRLSEGASWRMNLMGEQAESFRDGVDLKRYGFNPTAAFKLSDRTLLSLSYEYFFDERTADRGQPSFAGRPYDTARSRFFGNAEQSVARVEVNSLAAVLDHAFSNDVKLKNSFRVSHYDKFYQNVFASSAVQNAGTLNLAAYNSGNDRTNYFNQTDLSFKFKTGAIEHQMLVGLELGHQDSRNTRQTGYFGNATSLSVAAASPYGRATRFAATASDANNQVTADTAAVYLQDQIALSQEWKLLAGLRYDYYKLKLDDRRAAPTDLGRTDKEVSPRLGLIWQPNAVSTYYASYSYSFLPQGEQLSLATTNAQLKPESALNYELGARWDVLPKMTLSAAVFRTDRDDVKTKDPSDPTGQRLVLGGLQRTEGVEVGLQGEVTSHWKVYAGYAHLDALIEKGTSDAPAGRRVGLVPRNTLSVWNKFDLAGGWGLGLGVIYQSESYTSFSNTVKLPEFARVDGAVYYRFADGKTRLALNVENLTNQKYTPTAHSDNNISPGAPVNARLTLSTAF